MRFSFFSEKTVFRGTMTYSWNSSIFSVLISLLLFEITGGLYLFFSPDISVFYQYALLFHIGIGLLLIVPLVVYLFRHFQHTRGKKSVTGNVVGTVGYVLIMVACLTGMYQTFVGFMKDSYWISSLHTWVGFASALAISAHIVTSLPGRKVTGGNDGKVSGLRLVSNVVWKRGLTITAIVCFSLFFAVAVLTITYRDIDYKNERDTSYSMKYGKNPFYPSEAMTASVNVIDAKLMGNSRACASGGCHEDIYREWYASAHRYSSTDVFYRKAEEYFIETEGKEATRYCAGCHDPVALFSGGINPGEGYDTVYSEEGSSCIACHAITKIRHLKGSGSYLFTPPKEYVFANRKGWLYEQLHNLLIKTAPDLHKREYSKEFYSTPEYCATCHKQYIKDPNNWGWVKLQDQYGEWLSSHYSGRNDKGFHKDTVMLCRDCHMPLVESNDPAAGSDGKVRSHRFIAANSAIPWLDGDTEQFELTKKWLKGRKLLLTIFEPRDKNASRNMAFVDNEIYQLSEPNPYVTMGEEVELQIMLTNAGTGHGFPNGPLDIYESWLEVKVVDAQNNAIFWSGKADEKGYIEKGNTRFFFTLGLDRRGRLIDKHNLWHVIGDAYKKMILPGATDLSSYKFTVPYWVKGDITVLVRLRYRRFNKWYTDWVFGDKKDVKLPIIDMARATVSIPVRMRPDQERMENTLSKLSAN